MISGRGNFQTKETRKTTSSFTWWWIIRDIAGLLEWTHSKYYYFANFYRIFVVTAYALYS